jgi:hypothetical protein
MSICSEITGEKSMISQAFLHVTNVVIGEIIINGDVIVRRLECKTEDGETIDITLHGRTEEDLKIKIKSIEI